MLEVLNKHKMMLELDCKILMTDIKCDLIALSQCVFFFSNIHKGRVKKIENCNFLEHTQSKIVDYATKYNNNTCKFIK